MVSAAASQLESGGIRILFILGAQKAGTNFLHNALKGHRDVEAPSQTFRYAIT
jgi:hypothetical protein